MTTNQIPDKVESLFPPTVINTLEGRFAVFGGAGWYPVDDNFTLEDALKHWSKWSPEIDNTPKITIPDNTWYVKSSNGKLEYEVKAKDGDWSCTCKGYIFSGNPRTCKHIKQIKTKTGIV